MIAYCPPEQAIFFPLTLALPIPFSLQGVLTETMAVTGVGTAFDIDYEPGDRFVFDGQLESICVVDSIESATEMTLRYEFYGTTILVASPVTMTLLVANAPAEVEEVIRNYTLYRIWNRRARDDDQNPWFEAKTEMKELADRIQKGRYRFDMADGTEVDVKDTHYNDSAKTMTDDAFADYMDPEC